MAEQAEWDGRERRESVTVTLTDEQEERLAKRAAILVVENLYTEVGKAAVRLLLYVVGALCLGLLAWLGATGKVKI